MQVQNSTTILFLQKSDGGQLVHLCHHGWMDKQFNLSEFMFEFTCLRDREIIPVQTVQSQQVNRQVEKLRSSIVKHEPLDVIRVDLVRIAMKRKEG